MLFPTRPAPARSSSHCLIRSLLAASMQFWHSEKPSQGIERISAVESPFSVVVQFEFPQLCSSTKNPIVVVLSDSAGALRPRGSRRTARIFHLSILLQGVLPMHSASLRCLRKR